MNVYILTYGCTANQDNEAIIKGLLKDHTFVDSEDDADIVIVNTCIVKGTTENKIVTKIKSLKNKKIIITGCMPKFNYDLCKEIAPNASLISTQNITRITEGLTKKVEYLDSKKETKVGLIKVIKDIPSIQVSEGCVNHCYYCGTKLAKGVLSSASIEEIKKELEKYSNYKQINITATDIGCYGFDINTNLINLLKELVKVKGNFKLRVGMMNPVHVLKFVDELIEIFKNEKIVPFLHIPVQSGSNKVLKDMNRNYNVEDFKMIVNKFRQIQKVTIATDIIVGYPTETEEDFNETVKLIKEIKPNVLNISRFTPRKGTKASQIKQLNSQVSKKRSMELSRIYNYISKVC